jgi:predicted phage gp36 major capsid-like protein
MNLDIKSKNMQQSEEDRKQEDYWNAICKEMKEEMEFTLKQLNKEIQKLNLCDSNPIMRYMRDLMLYHIGE